MSLSASSVSLFPPYLLPLISILHAFSSLISILSPCSPFQSFIGCNALFVVVTLSVPFDSFPLASYISVAIGRLFGFFPFVSHASSFPIDVAPFSYTTLLSSPCYYFASLTTPVSTSPSSRTILLPRCCALLFYFFPSFLGLLFACLLASICVAVLS